jgi:hypothetical protein
VSQGDRLRTGAVLRTLINDLKRNDESAAAELGVDLASFRAMLAGERPIPAEVVERAVEIWPLNERDFHTIHADCPDGVRIVRRPESEASSRVLDRGGRGYYEYRDTAMSRMAMFRPEWIRMLQVVDSEDADDPRVEWNDGHLLHQFTYFVGDINYYYQWNGRRRCAAMRTGDSVWGLPFAPHSFTARRTQEPVYILALTYGAGLVGDAQHELAALGVEAARRWAIPVADEAAAGAALLRLHAGSAGMTAPALARLAGLPEARAVDLLAGAAAPDDEELERLAAALGVHRRDLLPVTDDTVDGVRLLPREQVPRWGFPDERAPDYRLGRLAGSRLHPFTRGMEIDVLAAGDGPEPAVLETACHQYVYCLGPAPVRLAWSWRGGRFEEVVEAGDSLYVQPFVPHRLRRESAGSTSRLLALRIAGKTRLEAMTELGAMAPDGVARVVAEDRQWYRPAGSAAAPAGGR